MRRTRQPKHTRDKQEAGTSNKVSKNVQSSVVSDAGERVCDDAHDDRGCHRAQQKGRDKRKRRSYHSGGRSRGGSGGATHHTMDLPELHPPRIAEQAHERDTTGSSKEARCCVARAILKSLSVPSGGGGRQSCAGETDAHTHISLSSPSSRHIFGKKTTTKRYFSRQTYGKT